MEDLLDLYAESYNENCPVICCDERPCQLISETKSKIPVEPGQVERYDYEYRREGTCNIFAMYELHTGFRNIEVTDRRTKVDFANYVKDIVDKFYPSVEKIKMVTDNLNTHTPASFYEAFSAEEARRLTEKIEFHYTPKHGSWLNQVEIELSILSRQCLNRRIPNKEILIKEVEAWEKERNARKAKINWLFKTSDARIKLKRLYPA